MNGLTPAVGLVNPKYAYNVGAILRTASCYGIRQLWWSGDRVTTDGGSRRDRRLPREERMREYDDVESHRAEQFLSQFPRTVTPVAIEVGGSEELLTFEHPEHAIYVFGPEDGSIPPGYLSACHRFVRIPSRHCLNLASAVATVLYDRHAKRVAASLEEPLRLATADVRIGVH